MSVICQSDYCTLDVKGGTRTLDIFITPGIISETHFYKTIKNHSVESVLSFLLTGNKITGFLEIHVSAYF